MATAALPRPAEKIAILSLVLVFLCGAVMGAVVMSFAGHSILHGNSQVSTGPTMSVAEWKQQLDLTDEQTVLLTSILDDYSRLYDDLLGDGNSRIMQILNPEQKRRLERMLAARRK